MEIQDVLTSSHIEDIESTNLQGSAISNLQKKAVEIRKLRINWNSYHQAEIIDLDKFNFIQKYDSAPNKDSRDAIIMEDRNLAAHVFLSLMQSLTKESTVQYLLTLLDDSLQEDKFRVNIFRDYCVKNKEPLWNHFFTFLQRNDQFIMYQASRIIAKIACWSSQTMEERDLNYFLNWLCNQLLIKDNEYIHTVARNLQMMLRVALYRTQFCSQNGIETIVRVLEKKTDTQIQYQLIFCLWCIGFDDSLVEKLFDSQVVPIISVIMSVASKEKVVRISAACCRQLLEKLVNAKTVKECALEMVQANVLKQIEVFKQKKLDHDPELKSDLEYLEEKLHDNLHDVTTLEEYTAELKSGRLTWSPAHSSEKFWVENVYQFNDKNYMLIKMLVKILESSKDPEILSVAVHDIGEYVRHYPRGKSVIEKLGAKTFVMAFLTHENASLRYYSLLALQKIMVHNWEYLGKQLDSAVANKTESRAK